MKIEDQIIQLARQQGLSCFFNWRARASNRPWITLSLRSGQMLAEFETAQAALDWFPKTEIQK